MSTPRLLTAQELTDLRDTLKNQDDLTTLTSVQLDLFFTASKNKQELDPLTPTQLNNLVSALKNNKDSSAKKIILARIKSQPEIMVAIGELDNEYIEDIIKNIKLPYSAKTFESTINGSTLSNDKKEYLLATLERISQLAETIKEFHQTQVSFHESMNVMLHFFLEAGSLKKQDDFLFEGSPRLTEVQENDLKNLLDYFSLLTVNPFGDNPFGNESDLSYEQLIPYLKTAISLINNKNTTQFHNAIHAMSMLNILNPGASLFTAETKKNKFQPINKNNPGLELDSYFIKPTQHIMRYFLIFGAMVKRIPKDSSLWADFNTAYTNLQAIAEKSNEDKREAEADFKKYQANKKNVLLRKIPKRLSAEITDTNTHLGDYIRLVQNRILKKNYETLKLNLEKTNIDPTVIDELYNYAIEQNKGSVRTDRAKKIIEIFSDLNKLFVNPDNTPKVPSKNDLASYLAKVLTSNDPILSKHTGIRNKAARKEPRIKTLIRELTEKLSPDFSEEASLTTKSGKKELADEIDTQLNNASTQPSIEQLRALDALLVDSRYQSTIKSNDVIRKKIKDLYSSLTKKVAGELMQISAHVFCQVPDNEMKSAGEKATASIDKLAIYSNHIVNMVGRDILNADRDIKKRAIVVEKWIAIMQRSMEIGDHQTALSIQACLYNSWILGLFKSPDDKFIISENATRCLQNSLLLTGAPICNHHASAKRTLENRQDIVIPYYAPYSGEFVLRSEKQDKNRSDVDRAVTKLLIPYLEKHPDKLGSLHQEFNALLEKSETIGKTIGRKKDQLMRPSDFTEKKDPEVLKKEIDALKTENKQTNDLINSLKEKIITEIKVILEGTQEKDSFSNMINLIQNNFKDLLKEIERSTENDVHTLVKMKKNLIRLNENDGDSLINNPFYHSFIEAPLSKAEIKKQQNDQIEQSDSIKESNPINTTSFNTTKNVTDLVFPPISPSIELQHLFLKAYKDRDDIFNAINPKEKRPLDSPIISAEKLPSEYAERIISLSKTNSITDIIAYLDEIISLEQTKATPELRNHLIDLLKAHQDINTYAIAISLQNPSGLLEPGNLPKEVKQLDTYTEEKVISILNHKEKLPDVLKHTILQNPDYFLNLKFNSIPDSRLKPKHKNKIFKILSNEEFFKEIRTKAMSENNLALLEAYKNNPKLTEHWKPASKESLETAYAIISHQIKDAQPKKTVTFEDGNNQQLPAAAPTVPPTAPGVAPFNPDQELDDIIANADNILGEQLQPAAEKTSALPANTWKPIVKPTGTGARPTLFGSKANASHHQAEAAQAAATTSATAAQPENKAPTITPADAIAISNLIVGALTLIVSTISLIDQKIKEAQKLQQQALFKPMRAGHTPQEGGVPPITPGPGGIST